MSNICTFPQKDTRDVVGEASEWLARIDRGLSANEEKQLKDWLTIEGHCETFISIAEMWDKMDVLTRLSEVFPAPAKKSARQRHPLMAMAASLFIAIAVALFAWQLNPFQADKESVHATQLVNEKSYQTSRGESLSATLLDGSEITLNTNSLVKVYFLDNERKLILERGEIHIKVAHDTERPLRVYVGEKIVEAVGTEFNLEIDSTEHVELIVTEGKVLVAINPSPDPGRQSTKEHSKETAEPILVSAGERLTLGEASEDIKAIKPEELNVILSWRGGSLVFRGESLAEAIAEIERYTPVEFVFVDQELKHIRVAGMFKTGDVNGLLTTLENNFNVSYTRVTEKKILLTKK